MSQQAALSPYWSLVEYWSPVEGRKPVATCTLCNVSFSTCAPHMLLNHEETKTHRRAALIKETNARIDAELREAHVEWTSKGATLRSCGVVTMRRGLFAVRWKPLTVGQSVDSRYQVLDAELGIGLRMGDVAPRWAVWVVDCIKHTAWRFSQNVGPVKDPTLDTLPARRAMLKRGAADPDVAKHIEVTARLHGGERVDLLYLLLEETGGWSSRPKKG